MVEKKQIRFLAILCLGILAACQTSPLKTEGLDNGVDISAATPTPETPTPETSTPETPTRAPEPPSTAYQEAIALASGAVTLGQQAQSPDDWDLIVGRWEQAIEKLKQVPTDHQHYATAQTKLKDYERNLTQAQQRLTQSQQPTTEIALAKPAPVPGPVPGPVPVVGAAAALSPGASVPIIERRGGTPVIEVLFNGRPYPMILDTGASHTHIPRTMAHELDIQVLGQAMVATASSSRVLVDVGTMPSIQVGNITRNNIPVSIGDAVPIGLLGNDVYKDFDVVLQADSIEFQPR